jgi:pilus assembly protein CpaE
VSQSSAILKGVFVGKKNEVFEKFADEVRPVVEITDWYPNPASSYGDLFRNTPPALVFVDLSDDPPTRLNLANRIIKAAPATLVFTVASSKSPDLILEAFRLGAADFLLWPGNQGEVLAAIRRALEKSSPGGRRGEVYSVFSMKGGQGVSTVALNLADHLHMLSGEKVLLFDLNLYISEIGVRLDLGAHYTPFDLQKDLKRLDQDLLFSSLLKHERDFYLLSCPDEINDADRIRGEDVTNMLDALTAHMDYLVLDLPHDFSPKTLAALEASDKILLLVQQDLAALKITLKVLQFFRELQYGENKIRLLVNRYTRKGDLDVEDLGKILQQPVFGTLENDYGAVFQSITSGKTVDLVAENSPFNRNIKELAGKLTGIPWVGAVKPLWQRALARCLPGFNHRK